MTGVIDRGHGDWLSSGVTGGLLLLVKAMMFIASMIWLVAVAGGTVIG